MMLSKYEMDNGMHRLHCYSIIIIIIMYKYRKSKLEKFKSPMGFEPTSSALRASVITTSLVHTFKGQSETL